LGQKLYSVDGAPPGAISKIVPLLVAPPPVVVPYRRPLMAWTSAVPGYPQSALPNLCRVVKVCAGSAAVIAPNRNTAQAALHQIRLPNLLTIGFIDAIFIKGVSILADAHLPNITPIGELNRILLFSLVLQTRGP